VCPRCKQESRNTLDRCTFCGFSFRETSAFEESEDSQGLNVGRIINNKYRIVNVLGEGGFGVVYKVELLLFDTENIFALKRLHPSLSQDPKFRRRFLREAALAMQLIHENTIQIREFGRTEEGDLFFTMDYCEGEPLSRVIAREGFLPVNRALHITLQVLSVMQLAHSRGIIHRDLKPENVFLERHEDRRDFVKVGDFGLAKSFGEESSSADITRGGILGTPRYMSPEQAKGSDDLDPRSDIYSVGVMLYEMLYGEVPGDIGTSERAPHDMVTPPAQPEHVVPGAVWQVVRKALAFRREGRFQSAEEFSAAIRALPVYTPSYVEPSLASEGLVPPPWWKMAAVSLVVVLLASLPFTITGSRPIVPQLAGLSGADPQVATPAEEKTNPPAPDSGAPTGASEQEEYSASDVRAYCPFRTGAVFTYEVVSERLPKDYRIAYEITDIAGSKESGFMTCQVKVSPGDRTLSWIVDAARNEIRQSFLLPDSETGELSRIVEREVLCLPPDRRPLREDYSCGKLKVHQRLESIKGRFQDCLVVESTEGNEQSLAFFKARLGLVALQVFELHIPQAETAASAPPERIPVYARYLLPPAVE
ncbi:MAG: serine/threonine protein kinase, partial [Planctomycetes bacterium]|nr:serine/threonine protein kinase [Planctomycetota bacterium]